MIFEGLAVNEYGVDLLQCVDGRSIYYSLRVRFSLQ